LKLEQSRSFGGEWQQYGIRQTAVANEYVLTASFTGGLAK
jgi:hypothetical protein